MEIFIGKGIDNIIFGISQEDALNILGKPDKISETEREKAIVYTYNQEILKLKFDEEDGYTLTSIEVHNPESILFSHKIINQSKAKIIELLKCNQINEFEFEEYDYFESLYCEKISATFQFEFDRLKSIDITPLYDSSCNYIWPRKDSRV